MSNKTYVFTGGGSGLALASAHSLIGEGTLLLCDKNAAALEKAEAQLATLGADVKTFIFDVADKASVNACAEYAKSLGDIYAVINAVGVSPAYATADQILSINGLGPVNMINSFFPILAEGGVMICFSSKASYTFDTVPQLAQLTPALHELYTHWDDVDFYDRMKAFLADVMQLPEESMAGMAYCLSKHFVRYFVRMNVWRFARKNCRILSISPGSYLTPMHQALIDNTPQQAENDMASIPMQRWGHPYEMASLVRFLCSNGAGYITGVDILPDGGGTLNGDVPQID